MNGVLAGVFQDDAANDVDHAGSEERGGENEKAEDSNDRITAEAFKGAFLGEKAGDGEKDDQAEADDIGRDPFEAKKNDCNGDNPEQQSNLPRHALKCG